MRRNAEEGFFNGGPVPFGYESRTVEMRGTQAKKKLFIHEGNAGTVRLMFDLATIGDGNGPMGGRAIAEWLNERGYTQANGAKFTNSNVAGILARTNSTEADERRARDLTQARLHKTLAEKRLRNLYEAVADGQASVREPVFANVLAETNARIASATAAVETLERQIGKSANAVTPEMVEAVATLVRDRLRDSDPALHRRTWRCSCPRWRSARRRSASPVPPRCSNERSPRPSRPSWAWCPFLTGDGAVEKTRTSTSFRTQPPQGCASTNSATTAR